MTHSAHIPVIVGEIYADTANDSKFEFRGPEPNNISLHAGSEEMLRVAPDGFYVRGVKVPVDNKEAETVYHAFKQWLAWANLQKQ